MRLILFTFFAYMITPSAWAEDNPSFNLVNRGRLTIKEIYATSAGQATWGQDRLQRGSVPANMNVPIQLPTDGNCLFDVRVVYENGTSEDQRRVNTCAVDSVSFPASRARTGRSEAAVNDPSFRLVNRGRAEVSELYVSLPDQDGWGDDRLGRGTVPPGGRKVIDLPSGACFYDLRIVYGNGEATEKRRVNLCTVTDLRVP